MTDAKAQLIEEARAVLGAKGVLTDPAEIAPWVTDWRGRVHGAASANLQPVLYEALYAVGFAEGSGIPFGKNNCTCSR